MNQVDIRKKIDQNNILIQQFMSPTSFTLNNVVSTLLEENRNLQKQCIHQFEDGFCIYCDLSEEE